MGFVYSLPRIQYIQRGQSGALVAIAEYYPKDTRFPIPSASGGTGSPPLLPETNALYLCNVKDSKLMNVKCKGYSHPFKPDPFFRRHRRPCGFKYLINVTLVNLVLGTGDFRIVTGSSRLSTFGLVSTSSPLAVSCTRVFEWFLSLQLSMIRRSWKQEP